jgi:hypothetical protein
LAGEIAMHKCVASLAMYDYVYSENNVKIVRKNKIVFTHLHAASAAIEEQLDGVLTRESGYQRLRVEHTQGQGVTYRFRTDRRCIGKKIPKADLDAL